MSISLSLSRTLIMSPSSLTSRTTLTPSLSLTLRPSLISLTRSRSAMAMPPPLSLSVVPYPLSTVSVLPPPSRSLSVTAMASVSEGAGQGDQTLGCVSGSGGGGDANGGDTKKDPWFRSLTPGPGVITGVITGAIGFLAAWYAVVNLKLSEVVLINLRHKIHLLKNLCFSDVLKNKLTALAALALSFLILPAVIWGFAFSTPEDEAKLKRAKNSLAILELIKKIIF